MRIKGWLRITALLRISTFNSAVSSKKVKLLVELTPIVGSTDQFTPKVISKALKSRGRPRRGGTTLL